MAAQEKSFQECMLQYLDKTFKLEQVRTLPALEQWLAMPAAITEGDPPGQALAAMLVGQSMDDAPKPLYGCYVIGNAWWFMALGGKTYAISQDYSAIRTDIFDIYRIFKALKQIVFDLTVVQTPA